MFYLLIFLTVTSCVNCKEFTKGIAKEKCIIVVKGLPTPNTKLFEVTGYDPVTQKSIKCESVSNWWNQYNNEIAVGDTIVKKEGELTFNIHKQDTIISHEWHCYED
ncbi:hypothetical protein F7R58_06650 [Chryseobacterium sp.]|nr:hypothetical protein F7R58_06650 [Chryseobacterium sp.]